MKKNRIALITGASCGIGKAFARHFAGAGFDLILTGRRKEKLEGVAEELALQFGIGVQIIIAELSDEKDVCKILNVIEDHDNIHILVNNAGYGMGKDFGDCDISCHLQMLQVHVVASLRLVYAVMPQMAGRREGSIINISSLSAFMPAPGSTVYSATKLFMKSFTESLHMEVKDKGIRMLCLCPGFTRTGFHERLANGNATKNNGLIYWMDPEKVVSQCIKSLEKGKIVYIPGFTNRMLVGISSVIPDHLYYHIMMRLTGRTVKRRREKYSQSVDVQPVL